MFCMMIKTNKIKEEELVRKLKDSFPDMLDFNNCLKELREFWKQQATADFKENNLLNKSNHQLGCMLECYEQVIANRIGFENEAKQLKEIASKLK